MRIAGDIKTIAKRYGIWANTRTGTEYPSIQPFMREVGYSNRHQGEPLSDDAAMIVHDCTLKMRAVTPDLYNVFMHRYVSGLEPAQVCKEMKIGSKTYKCYIYAALQSLKLLLTENKCIFLA
ncbi:hypothetical protein BKG91_11670 [Rodentibacter caecimuris]|uniref:antiterminator Q family protein n=1 Tax=Rodentibacter caecimuris TaxID=1796644 RepID=UPI00075142D0|nr:antiterminator Q family protein [Rodentibacter heylii]AOF53682.1 hypothetical protein AC062_1590 [Pasteurellaceae bacterium NI1060]OOF71216.1 hypothetical protein BKG91_11670 [Rodentibacter heylii]